MNENVNVNVKKKGQGRKRRFAGWLLIALGFVAAVCWVVLRWWKLVVWGDGVLVALDCGALHISGSETKPAGQTIIWGRTHSPQWELWAGIDSDDTGGLWMLHAGVFSFYSMDSIGMRVLHVLLWPVPVALWSAGVLVLRSGVVARRRGAAGRCSECGYSLAGLAEGAACPECGKAGATT